MDYHACNYGSTSSCEYTCDKNKVCGDPLADNYVAPQDRAAWEVVDNSVCIYYEYGCGMSECPNYDPLTKVPLSNGGHLTDNEQCYYYQVCNTEKDSRGVPYQNYKETLGSCDEANSSECIAGILGCMTFGDPNYNANATYDDGMQCAGSCPVTKAICCTPTNPLGMPHTNYVALEDRVDCDVCTETVCSTATIPVHGCMDNEAVNYNPNATVENGSCLFNWCAYNVTFEKEDATYDTSNASSLYSITMVVRVLLADYDMPPGKHPQVCTTLLDDHSAQLTSDLDNIIATLANIPIIQMTCTTCSNIIITNIPDLCIKMDGVDDPDPQTTVPEGYNRDSNGYCTQNVTGAVYCGTASQPNMTFLNSTDITSDMKCNPTNSNSTTVTRKTQSPSTFQWECSNTSTTTSCTAKSYCSADGMSLCDGICISSPNTCEDDCNGGVKCGRICLRDGSQCNNIPPPTFIEDVNVNPKVIRNDSDKCIVTWNTVKSADTDIAVCTFDGGSTGVNEISAGSWKRTDVIAGNHTISCTLTTESNTSITDTATARCTDNPRFIEF
jgi:hypothetical protein